MHFNLDNMYCGIVRRGDVVLCDVPGEGEAPMVSLQDTVLNETLGTILCTPLVPHGKGEDVYAGEVMIPSVENGLGKDAVCLPYHMKPIDRRSIVAKKAELSEERMEKVYEAVDIVLGRFRDKLL